MISLIPMLNWNILIMKEVRKERIGKGFIGLFVLGLRGKRRG